MEPEAVVQVKDYHMEQEFREQRREIEYIPIIVDVIKNLSDFVV